MSFLITVSDTPAVLDTMPALKLTYWNGCPMRDTVYSYGKLAFQDGALTLGGWIFDGNPASQQRFSAVFQFAPDTLLSYTVSPAGEGSCRLTRADGSVLTCQTSPLHMGAGCDEQGPYWSFEVTLPRELFLTHFGRAAAPQDTFFGNLFLYDTREDAFGSAFPVSEGAAPPADSFGSFIAVPY